MTTQTPDSLPPSPETRGPIPDTRLPSTLTLAIEGMSCASCAARVESALRSVPNVTNAAVNLTTNLAVVTLAPHEYAVAKAATNAVDAPNENSIADHRQPEPDTRSPIPDPQPALLAAVAHAGYRATPIATSSTQALRDVAARAAHHAASVRRRLLVGILASTPVLLLDLLPHETLHTFLNPQISNLLSLLLSTLVLLYTGGPFFTGARRAALHPNMDTLVALGAGTAYLYSLALILLQSFRHSAFSIQHSEFHAAVTIITLVTLGKFLEARAKQRANTNIAQLALQTSPTATLILPDGSTNTIPAEQVALGDLIQVTAHQLVPVDGEFVEGGGSLDASILTGESTPIELTPRPIPEPRSPNPDPPSPIPEARYPMPDPRSPTLVPGGATLLDGRIVLRATSTAVTSTAARILQLVQNAQSSKTQIQALADRVAAIFVPIVIALSLLTFLGWLAIPMFQHSEFSIQHFTNALNAAIATVIIACPCAMGLATPTAITVATGRAAKLGILFTNAAALETARNITAVYFDKTGTLTTGRFTLAEIIPAPSAPDSRFPIPDTRALLTLAASLEQFSDHPLAKSILTRANAECLTLESPDAFSSIPGGGLKGTIAGQDYLLGSLRFLNTEGIDTSPLQQNIDQLQSTGHTLLALAQLPDPRSPIPDTRPHLLGLFALRDTLRPDAASTLAALRVQGLRVGVISGDSEPAVRGILENIPVDEILAAVRPDEKATRIAQLSSHPKEVATAQNSANSHQSAPFPAKTQQITPKTEQNTPQIAPQTPSQVAFVGDGVNDAPALAAADLGISLMFTDAGHTGGTDLARAAGDVILTSGKLASIPQTLVLATATFRVIKQNLFWAFGYNIAAIPLAMLGRLDPGFAAAAMMLSSLSVVANALRLYRVKLP